MFIPIAIILNMKLLIVTLLLFLLASPSFVNGVDDDSHLRGRQLLTVHQDPKSVEVKMTVHVDDHPNFSNLRFLFFGTSRTWGSGMPDRLNQAFPFLLHPNSTNLAIPGGHSLYPRSCTASMLKDLDGAFDVIIMEFAAIHFQYTLQLAQRLRKRYPHSVIYFFEMWKPLNIFHEGSGQSLPTWWAATQPGFSSSQQEGSITIDPSLPDALKALTTPKDWKFRQHDMYKESQVQQMKSVVGASLLRIPGRTENVHNTMAGYAKNYLRDMNHYSIAGHEFIAHVIYDTLWGLGIQWITAKNGCRREIQTFSTRRIWS